MAPARAVERVGLRRHLRPRPARQALRHGQVRQGADVGARARDLAAQALAFLAPRLPRGRDAVELGDALGQRGEVEAAGVHDPAMRVPPPPAPAGRAAAQADQALVERGADQRLALAGAQPEAVLQLDVGRPDDGADAALPVLRPAVAHQGVDQVHQPPRQPHRRA